MSAKPKKGLGRGFASLIPDELLDESFDPTSSQDEQVSDLRTIKVSEIQPDPEQPRRSFDQKALEQLAASIREHGILQPIVVVVKAGSYTIVAGERRWRAAKLAELDKIPAIVRTLSDQHKLELSLIENLQRRNLNPLETATAYVKLRDQFNMSLEDIARRMGAGSISTISNKLRLLKLPVIAKKALMNHDITEGQARPLIGLDEQVVRSVLPKIMKENWSARKIEQYVVELKHDAHHGEVAEAPKKRVTLHEKEMQRLSKTLNTAVKIRSNAKGAGNITIAFASEEERERIEALLLK